MSDLSYISGVLSAMSAMVNLEIPWINIMSKMDLVTPSGEDSAGGARNGLRGRKEIARWVSCPCDLFQCFVVISPHMRATYEFSLKALMANQIYPLLFSAVLSYQSCLHYLDEASD
jgi:hypothetical protein